MIHYKPNELPELYQKLKGTDGTRTVAVHDGILIQFYDSGGTPTFLVSYENDAVDEISAEPEELVETAKTMYGLYLGDECDDGPIVSEAADPPDNSDADDADHVLSKLELEHEEEIDQSETELYEAAVNFISAVTDIDPVVIMEEHDDVVDDFLEHALKYIHLKHGLDIYRPMVIQMDDGTEVYKDFPYPFLDLSDEESNPVYMPE